MKCVISTPVNTEIYDKLISVTIPTTTGPAQIKKGHAEYMANLISGEITCITQSQKSVQIFIQEGICRVMDDTVTVVV